MQSAGPEAALTPAAPSRKARSRPFGEFHFWVHTNRAFRVRVLWIHRILFACALRLSKPERADQLLFVAALSVPALFADIFLLFVSVIFIKAMCPLCIASYAATAFILAASLIALWHSRKGKPARGLAGALRSLASFVGDLLLFHGLVVLTLVILGAGIGILARRAWPNPCRVSAVTREFPPHRTLRSGA